MTRKHLTIMEWISTGYCNKVPYLVKVDDDTFIDIFHLTSYLENKQPQLNNSFYCSATANVKVKRPNLMKNSKWEITNKEFSDSVFPTYCEGFGYVMDMKLAPYLYWCSMFQSPIWIDDVYVTGILSEILGIQRIPFQNGHGYANLKPGREEGSLADSIFLLSLYNEFYPLTFHEMWRESVMYTSKSKKNICTLPKKVGFCPKKHKRFYYDSKSQQCLEFTYSGCGGNKNRFRSKEECERVGKKSSSSSPGGAQTTVNPQSSKKDKRT
ncbi:unnamed protein product [Trichobilharzia regenti]|nr:unnamed protein product [Trichobilharzia regenti]